MQDTTRPTFLKVVKTLDSRDVRHSIVSAGYDDGIKPLHPPVVAALALSPQRELPLTSDLLGELNRRIIRHKVLVTPALYEALDVSPHDLPVSKRRIRSMNSDRPLAPLRGYRLLRELHGHAVDVRFKIGIDGGVRESRPVHFWRLRGEFRGDGHGLVGVPGCKRG